MNLDEIRALMELMQTYGLARVKVKDGDFHISLSKYAPTEASAPAPLPVSAPQREDPGISFQDASEIKSPMVGVFYTSPSPNAAPFVEVGSRVRKGETLCIIEAMKLLNEITSDRDGEIVDRLVENGEVVEYGQTLFRIL